MGGLSGGCSWEGGWSGLLISRLCVEPWSGRANGLAFRRRQTERLGRAQSD